MVVFTTSFQIYWSLNWYPLILSCLTRIIWDYLVVFYSVESAFPHVTGLRYTDCNNDQPCHVLCRNNVFVVPEGGWVKEGRKYIAVTTPGTHLLVTFLLIAGYRKEIIQTKPVLLLGCRRRNRHKGRRVNKTTTMQKWILINGWLLIVSNTVNTYSASASAASPTTYSVQVLNILKSEIILKYFNVLKFTRKPIHFILKDTCIPNIVN